MGTHALHRKLLLSTSMLVGALAGYGRSAHAACVPGAPPTFVCSGTETTTQTIAANNADVSTIAGFSVDTTGSGGNAITITGNGALFYVDTNTSSLTAATIAFFIQSTGDDGGSGTDGSVTVNTDGTLTGGNFGILASNSGSGALSVTANGDVAGIALYGIRATNDGTDLEVITGAGTTVTGGFSGISASNSGSGETTVTANGNVEGTLLGIIGVQNFNGTDLSVTTGAGTTVTGGFTGIRARNYGTGALDITANGDVTGTSIYGILATNDGTDLEVITGAGTTVTGGVFGITASNFGSGETTVTANGNVEGTVVYGIGVQNFNGTDLSVTTGAGTTVAGGNTGIRARNYGTGALDITANGNVTGTVVYGIYAYSSGTDLSVTTGAGTTVAGGNTGIYAGNFGSETLSITANGNVTGTNDDGIYARHNAGGPIDITIGSGSIVTSNGTDADDFAIETRFGPSDVTVAGTLIGGAGGAIQFDQVNALDDRLELHPSAIINGLVLAGPGTDTLAFGGTGDGAFDLSNIDTGGDIRQYRDFEIFQVESGTWNMTGATAAAFTVNGGTLGGTGTFGDLTVNNGAIIAPGNSIGTLIVNGAFTLAADAVYEVEVNAAGQSDKIIVKGTVNLTGATLRVLAANGNYQPSTDYTIIDNDGGDAVTGTFATITSSLAFLTPTVVYNGGTGNDVVLTLIRNDSDFCAAANTSNQCNVGMALDQFPTDNALYLAALNQTAAGARQAFDALSGEIHATLAGVLADDSRYVREAILGRLMQASHGDSAGRLASLGAAGPQMASLDASAMALGSPLAGGKSL